MEVVLSTEEGCDWDQLYFRFCKFKYWGGGMQLSSEMDSGYSC